MINYGKELGLRGGIAILLAEVATLSYFGPRYGLGKDVLLSATFLIALPTGIVTTFATRGILEIRDIYARARGRNEYSNGLE